MYEMSGLEVVLVALTGRFVEERVMIETSALTERSARERHVLILTLHGHVVASPLSTRCCSSLCASSRDGFTVAF